MRFTSIFGGARAAAFLAWSFLGIGGQAVVRLVSILALARLVLPEHFGTFALASAVIGFVPMTVYVALRLYLVRDFAKHASLSAAVLLIAVLCGLAAIAGISVVAGYLERAMAAPGLSGALWVMTPILILDALAVVPEATLVSTARFKTLAFVELWSTLLGAALVSVGVAWLLDGGLWALVSGAVAQSTLRYAFLWSTTKGRRGLHFSWPRLNELAHFSTGMIVMQIGNYAALQGDTFAVGRLLGSEALGAYGRAYQLMAVPATMLGGVVDRILYPTLCRAREHKRFFRRELIRVTGRFAAILLPTSVCLLIIGPELVLGLLGPMWVTAVTPFQILVSVLYFRAAYKVGDCAIRAIGQVYNAALRHWIYAGMVICGAVLGSLWGLKGVAAGVSIAIALNWVSIFSLVCSAAGVSSRLFLNAHVVGIVLSIVVGILTSAVVGMLRPFDSALLTICSALLVLAGVLGLGGTLLRQSSEARRLARLTSHAR